MFLHLNKLKIPRNFIYDLSLCRPDSKNRNSSRRNFRKSCILYQGCWKSFPSCLFFKLIKVFKGRNFKDNLFLPTFLPLFKIAFVCPFRRRNSSMSNLYCKLAFGKFQIIPGNYTLFVFTHSLPRAYSRSDYILSVFDIAFQDQICLLYTSPSPRDGLLSRM